MPENNYIIVDGELYHYGTLGMKWGKRKKSSVSTKVKNAVSNRAKKHSEANRERDENTKKATDRVGVAGVALRTYASTNVKFRAKSFLAKTINSAANAYINSDKGNYYTKQGAHYARKSAIAGLSISTYADTIRGLSDVGKAYVYASQKASKQKEES